MKKKTGEEVELIKGTGGAFEVVVKGETIFSKKTTGAFPDEDQLLKDVKAKLDR
ncbi:MAG: hypothetical protein C0602_01750 [Denitrovibrio sp.]|nr:MAG: hypothetical protein C0602_01750 [Denitrovibrio sp.]